MYQRGVAGTLFDRLSDRSAQRGRDPRPIGIHGARSIGGYTGGWVDEPGRVGSRTNPNLKIHCCKSALRSRKYPSKIRRNVFVEPIDHQLVLRPCCIHSARPADHERSEILTGTKPPFGLYLRRFSEETPIFDVQPRLAAPARTHDVVGRELSQFDRSERCKGIGFILRPVLHHWPLTVAKRSGDDERMPASNLRRARRHNLHGIGGSVRGRSASAADCAAADNGMSAQRNAS